MNMKTIANRDYVGSDADIRDMTESYIAHTRGGEGVKDIYLRVLAATTIHELGAQIRSNSSTKRHKLSDQERAVQLAALATVHGRFYAIINEVVEASLSDLPAKERATERNRRTNFARTALYALRLYVRAGKDLTAVAPGRLTKSAIAVEVVGAPATPRRLKGRLDRASKAFVKSLLAFSEADRDGAVAELDTLIGIMAAQLAALGVASTRNPKKAAADHVPLQVGSQLFVPTQTTILRQRARPS